MHLVLKLFVAYSIILLYIFTNVFYSNNDLASLGIVSITLSYTASLDSRITNSCLNPVSSQPSLSTFTTVTRNHLLSKIFVGEIAFLVNYKPSMKTKKRIERIIWNVCLKIIGYKFSLTARIKDLIEQIKRDTHDKITPGPL